MQDRIQIIFTDNRHEPYTVDVLQQNTANEQGWYVLELHYVTVWCEAWELEVCVRNYPVPWEEQQNVFEIPREFSVTRYCIVYYDKGKTSLIHIKVW